MNRGQTQSEPHRGAALQAAAGFSVVELIAVMAIILVMLALLGPAMSGFGGTTGRKAAVTTIMNTFEQARAAALETGTDVLVLLWRREFPKPDAVMVVRESSEWDTASGDYVPLTRWITLPRGIILRSLPVESLADSGTPSGFAYEPPGEGATEAVSSGEISALRFNPSGAVTFPASGSLHLFLSEGVRDANGENAQVGSEDESTVLERLLVSRFTGRTQLDITATSDTSRAN